MFSEEDFLEWKRKRFTKAFIRGLQKKREVIKEDIVQEHYSNGEFARGKAMALLEIVEMDWEQIKEIVNDKQVGD